MEMRPSLFTTEQRGLGRRAWFDLHSAVTLLESSENIQGSIVSSHEAAEKFLKIALIHEGVPYEKLGRGELRHDLNNLIRALASKHPKYKFVKRAARDLESVFGSMTTQRYESTKCSIPDAVAAFRLARHSAGFVAMQIELDDLRGTADVAFRLGRYYQDYAGREYRFCGVGRGDSGELCARLYLLGAVGAGQTIDTLCNFRRPCSFHYREIKERATIAKLEQRYSDIQRRMRTEQRHQNPERKGAQVEMIHESFDAMVSIKVPISKSRN
jgi:HEPN domain-containing protein